VPLSMTGEPTTIPVAAEVPPVMVSAATKAALPAVKDRP